MGALGALLLLAVLSLPSVLLADTPKHAIRHENFALYSNEDGEKILDFGISSNHRHRRDVQSTCNSDQSECVHVSPTGSILTVRDASDTCKIVIHSETATESTPDCFPMQSYHWFGGAEQKHQHWPLENFASLSHAVVPVELEDRAIADPLWYNSAGTLIFAEKTAPLFYEQNTVTKDNICLVGKLSPPFRPRDKLEYTYYVCKLSNAKEAFQYAIANFIQKPSGYPNENMIRYPIWSTWARYKTEVNDSIVRVFAKEITNHGFKGSHLELDDRWETCYGSTTFDKQRFPDMKKLSNDLHTQGLKVTLWSHFFIQLDCEATLTEATEAGYLVKDMNNLTASKWWNGNAAVVDFTNEDAKNWWVSRHKTMMEENGIDGMKFDAGETSWMPQLPQLNIPKSPKENYPGQFTENYVRACATFGDRTEFRTAHHTRDLPIFIRMIDKDSRWGFDNGLKTLVTTLLQMNSVGYPMVLPDMIGGNAYNGDVVTKEMFIRWFQANTFMPSQQYSLVPWEFDDETIKLAQQFADLHDKYTDTIMKAMKKSTDDGTPVNPPIWWLDPTNDDALKDNSEFLVGEDILVAPVLDDKARARDIVVPKGTWMDANTQKIYEGPTIIKSYPAPLELLPYFLRIDNGYATTQTPLHSTVKPQPTNAPVTSPSTTKQPSSASPLLSKAFTTVLASAVVLLLTFV